MKTTAKKKTVTRVKTSTNSYPTRADIAQAILSLAYQVQIGCRP